MSSRRQGKPSTQHKGRPGPELISQTGGIDIDIRHMEDDCLSPSADITPDLDDDREVSRQRREQTPDCDSSTSPSRPDSEDTNDHPCQFSEDSRPMFSPVPSEFMDDEEKAHGTPRHEARMPRDAASLPAIHVDRSEKTLDTSVIEPKEFTEGLESPTSEHLRVPSPLLYRKTDGRVVLMTQDSNRKTLGAWSLSEGNLPEALRRCPLPTPLPAVGGRPTHLDVGHRSEWMWQTATRGSSDVALNELRKERDGRCPTPGRLTSHLQPLSTGSKVMSTSSIQTP